MDWSPQKNVTPHLAWGLPQGFPERIDCLFGKRKTEPSAKSKMRSQMTAEIRNSDTSKAARISALLPESIGDFLLVSPSLNSLNQHFKNSKITWYLPESISEISKLLSLRTKRSLFTFEKNKTAKADPVPDITLCFPPAVKYYRLARQIGGTIRAGYAHEKMLSCRFVSRMALTHCWVCRADSKIHELEAYGKILSTLNIPFYPSFPELNLSAKSVTQAETWISENTRLQTPKIIAIHLGSRWAENPLPFFKDLLTHDSDFFLLTLYASDEEKKASEWISEFRQENGSKKILAPGLLSLEQYACYLKSCQIFIGVDGGPVHLASILKKPVIVFYPIDQFDFRVMKWHPWGVQYKAFPLLKKSLISVPDAVLALLNWF